MLRRTRTGMVLVALASGGLLAALAFAADTSEPPPVAFDEREAPVSPPDPEKPAPFLFAEGTRLVDRAGRIVSYEQDVLGEAAPKAWHRSAFVTTADEHVFILIENTSLQRAEDLARRGEVELRVSGTVTRYRDKNYLLITRAATRPRTQEEAPW